MVCWQVEPIVQAVKHQGDTAVKQFTEKFDRVKLDNVCSPIKVRHLLQLCVIAPSNVCLIGRQCCTAWRCIAQLKFGNSSTQVHSDSCEFTAESFLLVMLAGFSRPTATCGDSHCFSDCF